MKDRIKRIFIDRKLRELNLSEPTKNIGIIKEIHEDLSSRYGTDIPFDIEVPSFNQVRISYRLKTTEEPTFHDSILETFAVVYTGEWYDYRPPFGLPTMPRFPNMAIYIEKAELENIVKKNTRAFHGSRIKSAVPSVSDTGFTIDITF